MKDLIYIDCEFACPLFPELLSLGMVTTDGQEHYVELDPCDPSAEALMDKSSNMVQDQVLSQFGRVPDAACSRQEMGARTAAWLTAQANRLGSPARIAFDCPRDYDLLVGLLRDTGHLRATHHLFLPYNTKELTCWFDSFLGADLVRGALERRRGLGRHHALADAHALRGACVAALTGKRVTL